MPDYENEEARERIKRWYEALSLPTYGGATGEERVKKAYGEGREAYNPEGDVALLEQMRTGKYPPEPQPAPEYESPSTDFSGIEGLSPEQQAQLDDVTSPGFKSVNDLKTTGPGFTPEDMDDFERYQKGDDTSGLMSSLSSTGAGGGRNVSKEELDAVAEGFEFGKDEPTDVNNLSKIAQDQRSGKNSESAEIVRKYLEEKGTPPSADERFAKSNLIAGLGQAGSTIGHAISGTKVDPRFWDGLRGQAKTQFAADLAKLKEKRENEFKMDLAKMKTKLSKGSGGFKAATDLRKEYQALETSKASNTVLTAYNKIKASAEDPSAAGDLALIFNYMKMLDPNSVVRESEFANAANAASVPARIRNYYNRVVEGTRLGDIEDAPQRDDFLNMSANLATAQLDRQQIQDTRYSELARRYGVDPSLVVDASMENLRVSLAEKKKNRKGGDQMSDGMKRLMADYNDPDTPEDQKARMRKIIIKHDKKYRARR